MLAGIPQGPRSDRADRARDVLDEVLRGYRRPNDKVSEWIREGALPPLRRGLDLAGPGLRTSPACLPLLANHLYRPSYVSLDFALAFHGLIPEGVAEVTSVTLKPARRISNGLGRFSYHHLPLRYDGMGQQLGVDAMGLSFLIASPTKGLGECQEHVLTPHELEVILCLRPFIASLLSTARVTSCRNYNVIWRSSISRAGRA